MSLSEESFLECPNGHGPLKEWSGRPQCWTCGWYPEGLPMKYRGLVVRPRKFKLSKRSMKHAAWVCEDESDLRIEADYLDIDIQITREIRCRTKWLLRKAEAVVVENEVPKPYSSDLWDHVQHPTLEKQLSALIGNCSLEE